MGHSVITLAMHSPALSGAARSRLRTPRSQPSGRPSAATARPQRRSWNDATDLSVLPVRLKHGERAKLLDDEDAVVVARPTRRLGLAQLTNAVLFGVINSILTIPCMYGYAAIIFSHHDFVTYMPSLAKLVMFSSVVHQVMFTLLSSLPFAIGQVQDAGLIFLSAMATSICTTLGATATLEAKVATVVVLIGLATASLGVCLVLIGRFKLAGLVSYLPMPVVGGYLAYIGLFCMYAGLSLSTGLVINDFTSLLQLWSWEYVVLSIPGLVGGLVLLLVSQRCENSFALPACILGMPLLFYIVMWLGGASLEDARDSGWVSPDSPPATFLEMWNLFDFAQVQWSVLPQQITTWLGMVFVVAFSSCLDVAAIEMDMGKRLDINHELSSVGWSNVVSGVFGGYTGSYIFSQTIFTYRSKTNSRVVGLCVILSEFAVVLMPISVMSYVPRFFFAATLIFIAIDLMVEWLVHVYHKVLLREYIVLWASFIAINWVSLELGMLLGIGFAILNFLLGYSQVQVVTRAFKRSSAVRKYAARTVLTQKRDAIVFLELHGYLFFGSSVRILEDVQKAVHVKKKNAPPVFVLPHRTNSMKYVGHGIPLTPLSQPQHYEVMIECLDGSPAQEPEGLPTEFVVMDFSRVSGMDATAARSSLMILQQLCKSHDIRVLFADVIPEIRKILLQNEIAEHGDFFPTADIALEYCENRLLVAADIKMSDATSDDGRDVGIRALLHRFIGEPDDSMVFQGIDRFCRRLVVNSGHVFYHVGDDPDQFYFLASGRVALFMNQDGSSTHEKTLHLLEHVIPGAMFGEVDFFGRQLRTMAGRAMENCVVYEMSRENYEALEAESPELWNRLRDVVIMSMALAITNTTSINSCNNAAGSLREGDGEGAHLAQ